MLGISFLAKLVILHIILGMAGQVFRVVGVVEYLITADICSVGCVGSVVVRVVTGGGGGVSLHS